MGAADGSIVAIIIIHHMTKMSSAYPMVHDIGCIAAIGSLIRGAVGNPDI
jgi:hypothetical protein